MSSRDQDLQQHVEFDQISRSLAPIKICISGVPPSASSSSSCKLNGDGEHKYEEQQECRTPTSKENKIPVKLECPPAPKKPVAPRRETTISRKRKSLLYGEAGFFQVVNQNEVDAFFRVLEGAGNSLSSRSVVKRRRIRAGL